MLTHHYDLPAMSKVNRCLFVYMMCKYTFLRRLQLSRLFIALGVTSVAFICVNLWLICASVEQRRRFLREQGTVSHYRFVSYKKVL